MGGLLSESLTKETLLPVASQYPWVLGIHENWKRLFRQPAGGSTVTILTFWLPNEPREPDGDSDAGISWENINITQISALGVLSWYLSIFRLRHHANI